MLRRLLAALAFALFCGHASACVLLTGAGACTNSGPHPISTPALVPQPSTLFGVNSSVGTTNTGLKTNGGTAGAMFLPPSPTTANVEGSFAIYGEAMTGTVQSATVSYLLGRTFGVQGLELTQASSISIPYFTFNAGSAAGQLWWTAPQIASATTTGANSYVQGGYNPWTATNNSNGCLRPPSGIYAGTGKAAITDPGFECGAGPLFPTVTVANVIGSGAQQATGTSASPPLTASTCTANSPAAGQVTITTHVTTQHYFSPGMTYTLTGFPSPFSTTYTALPGTTSTTMVGAATINSGACTGFTGEGTAGLPSATGATITATAYSTTAPNTIGGTGITAKLAQHFCYAIGEVGADSTGPNAFPGSQYIAMVDDKGVNLLAVRRRPHGSIREPRTSSATRSR